MSPDRTGPCRYRQIYGILGMTKNTKESDAGRVRETNFMHGRPNPIDVVIGMVTSEAHSAPVKLIPSLVAGMDEYFPQYSWTLVHASSSGLWQPTCAPDGYVKNLVAVQAPRFGVHRVTYPWHDVPAKTNGFRAILEFAQRTCAKVCLIADPAQAGFERRWVDSLVRPGIHSKYDLVTPVYSNGSREHLISGNLLSPLMKALFGHGPKQPMPGEFMLSASLINRILARHDWDSASARYTPEMWIAFIAAAEGYRMAESAVGPSVRQSQAPKLSRQTSIEQITGSLISLMEQYEDRWSSPVNVVELDRFGESATITNLDPNRDGLEYEVSFVEAFPALRGLWQSILDPHTFTEIDAFYSSLRIGDANKPFGDALWVRIFYEIAAAWKNRLLPRSQVLGLFTPLLLARIGSFLMERQWKEQAEVEAELCRTGRYFEALRPVLDRLWFNRKPLEEKKRAKAIPRMKAA